MSVYRSLLHKDVYLSRYPFALALLIMLFLQLGCFLLTYGAEAGLATVLAMFVTYLSAFLLPVLFIHSLQAEWKTNSVYFWVNSLYSGYPVILSKLAVALVQTVLVMVLSSLAMFSIYTYEVNVIGVLKDISQAMLLLLSQTYRMDAILLLYAAMLSLGLGFLYLAGKTLRYGWFPAFIGLCVILAVSIGSMQDGWFAWQPFRLPFGVSQANASLTVEYTTYSFGGLAFLLLLALALLAANNILLKWKVQIS
ncbi:MAG: hypothetical protein K6T85_07460 [Gorillibacterium sp.]|nr:hypothetical protein [Gorillibacterium sp.]